MKKRLSFPSGLLRISGAMATPVSCLLLIEALPQAVYGYTDPGSGVLALQMLAAATFGALFHFRRLVNLCTKLLRKDKRS